MRRARSRARTGSLWWLIRLTGDPDGAAVGFVDAGQAGQQRRLARAGRADQATNSPGSDVQGDPPQGQGLLLPGPEEPVEGFAPCSAGALGGVIDHRKESVTMRHGSTLSPPTGAPTVMTTSVPALKKAYRSNAAVVTLPVTALAGGVCLVRQKYCWSGLSADCGDVQELEVGRRSGQGRYFR